MVEKQTIEEIVKKVDRKLADLRTAEFYRIDFPAPGEDFDINSVLAYEISPDRAVNLTAQLTQMLKIIATSIVLFLIFFFLFNAPAYFQILQSSILGAEYVEIAAQPAEQELLVLSKDPIQQKQQFPSLNMLVTPPDNRLIIPKINKNIPIVEIESVNETEDLTNIDDEILNGLKNGVVRYPGTAKPGEEGNIFLTGHSSYYLWDDGEYKEVFALLFQLEVGDQVIVYYDQEKFIYQITEKKEVAPSEVNVLAQPDGEHKITLMTCTPVGTNLRRLILVGEQTSR